MSGLAARFFGSAVVYALLGMMLGLVMGMTKDHSQMPTHAHFLVIGWVSFAIYGMFYHLFPAAASGRVAAAQFWLAQISFVALMVGLFLIFAGYPDADPVAAAASTGFLVSAVLFAVVAFPVVTGSHGQVPG